jgi:hypothetical protein
MKTGLTIEQHDIAIDNMSLNSVTILKPVCNGPSISKLEILFEAVASRSDIISPRVYVAPISYGFSKSIYVEGCHTLGIRKNFSDTFWDSNLVYTEVRIWGNDSTSREIDTLSREVASEPPLFSF